MATSLDLDVSLLIVTSIHDDIEFIGTEWSGSWEGTAIDGDETSALGECLRLHFLKDDLKE